MAKKVTIDIEVNGKMQKATLSAKKLKKALDETKASQDGLNASTRKGYRAMQGSAQSTSNSTKAFSKQAGVVGGLVPVYATFAANVFAVSAAFGVLKRAAALERLETSLERIGALSGRNLGALAEDLKNVADQAISSEQALRAVSVGTSAGFSSSQILQLTEVAKGASLALGRDMGDAIDRLIRGTAKLEPEILDELGIIVRLDQATQDYASQTGKLANELTQFERVQAFVNATITQGLGKYEKIAQAVDPSPYDKLAASFNNLSKEIIVFSNNVLGPVVDFFATNKIALTAALTFFAGTLVNQVIPAIDDVIARNAAIATSAAAAARKGRTKVIGEFEKQAKQIKTLDFSPPIAKQLIPQIKAGQASTKDLKRAISSLLISEKKRLAHQTKNATTVTAKYKAETAAIIEQRKALEALAMAERGREGYTTAGRNAASRSRSAKRNAIYGQAIDNAGFIDSLGIATRGVKNQAKEIGRSEKVLGKFTATMRTAGTAVSLFGRAFLNAIPVIGQLLFVLSLVGPAIMSVFGAGPVQKTLDELDERFSIFAKTVSLVKEEIKEAGGAFEIFSIKARASVGVFDEIKAGLIALGKTIDEEAITKFNEAIERQEVLAKRGGVRGGMQSRVAAFGRVGAGRSATANTDPREALDTIGTIGEKDALKILDIAESKLGKFEDILPGVARGFKKTREEIKRLAEDGSLSLATVLAFIDKIQQPIEDFVGNTKNLTTQFAVFNTEVNKLAGKATTAFSPAIDGSLELGKTLNSVVAALPKHPFKSIEVELKDLKSQFPGAEVLAKNLQEALNLKDPITNARDLRDRFNEFNELLEKNNNIILKRQGTLKKEQAILSELSRLEKIGASFTSLRLEQEDKVIDAKVKVLEAQRENTELLLTGAAETERVAAINAEIDALTDSKKSKEERALAIIEAQGAQKKRLLDIEQKLADLALKKAQLEFEQKGRDDERTLRGERQNNPFAFLDEPQRALDLEIARTEELLRKQNETVDDRAKRAGELASLEYEVLAARLAAEAKIAQIRATEILEDKENLTPERQAAAGKLNELAGELLDLSGRVGANAAKAGENAEAEVRGKVDALANKLGALRESREDLEFINVLVDGTAKSLENNMTSAFASLIDGTKSAKEAFRDMAKAILADIAQMIAKQLVYNALTAATGGLGGLFGRQGGIFEETPGMRYGGVTEKVQQFTGGGIAKGRQAGYPVVLHGTEAVVPLPNGKEIPVEMKNGGQMNNVTVNVHMDGQGNTQMSSEGKNSSADMGYMIAAAVQKELQNQKRSGGILNPYGTA